MENENIKKCIENAYAHVPTLPGYWISFEKFEQEFNKSLNQNGSSEIGAKDALEKEFPGYKYMENYKTDDMADPIAVIRLTPNKLKRINNFRKHLIENINNTPSSEDGWKNFAVLGQKDVKSEMLDLGFTSLKEAMIAMFPRFYEFKVGDTAKHEPPLMFRSLKWEEEKSQQNAISVRCQEQEQEVSIKAIKKQPKAKLLEFALFLPFGTGFDEAIKQLKEKALQDEQWSYGENNGKETFPILKSYLTYTFDRLATEDEDHKDDETWSLKIKESEDGRFAVFNTGLVDELYEPIYAWFRRNKNERPGGAKWIFRQFVKSTDKERQILARIFGTDMPKAAHYFNATSELVYDIRHNISYYNWKHFVERCERLPFEFLKRKGPAFDYDRKKKDDRFYKELSEAILHDPISYNDIKDSITNAIRYALKRVEWNFKTAIPIYYPTKKNISLLLPLALVDRNKIDCALALEADDSNASYIAHTILTLKMAYNDARLITRPDSDWLVVDNIGGEDA